MCTKKMVLSSIPHRSRYIKQSKVPPQEMDLWFEIFVHKIWKKFKKHFQETRKFEEKLCYAQTPWIDCAKNKTVYGVVLN